MKYPCSWDVNNLSEIPSCIISSKHYSQQNNIDYWIAHRPKLRFETWISGINYLDYPLIKVIYLMIYHRCIYFRTIPLLLCSRFNFFKNHLITKINRHFKWITSIQYMFQFGCNILVLNKHYKSNKQMNLAKISWQNLIIIKLIKFNLDY